MVFLNTAASTRVVMLWILFDFTEAVQIWRLWCNAQIHPTSGPPRFCQSPPECTSYQWCKWQIISFQAVDFIINWTASLRKTGFRKFSSRYRRTIETYLSPDGIGRRYSFIDQRNRTLFIWETILFGRVESYQEFLSFNPVVIIGQIKQQASWGLHFSHGQWDPWIYISSQCALGSFCV